MIYLLDTNVCVTYLRGKNSLLKQRVDAHPPPDAVLCSVVLAELFYGAGMSNHPSIDHAKVRTFTGPFTSLPFGNVEAELSGNLRAHLDKLGTPIGPYDVMIAATALAQGIILVTHNTSEFTRVPGLTLEDWEIP